MLKKRLLACTLLGLLAAFIAACSTPTPTPIGKPPATYPPAGTPGAVVMPPLSLGTHANIVYFVNSYSSRTSFSGILKRYDTTTQKSLNVSAMPNVKIEEAQLSRDGQWILFIAYVTDHDELRLVRVDGQYLQTVLYGQPYEGFSNARWSPNQQYIVFDRQPAVSGPTITYLLDIQHKHLQPELVPPDQPGALNYAPRKWIDNTHVALVGFTNTYSPFQNIYILDTQKGANQQPGDLQQITTGTQTCYDFDTSDDASQLFISTCTYSRQQGTSTITVRPIKGGASQTIFRSSTLAIQQIRVLRPHTLLLLTQNEFWSIHTDGTGLTRILTGNDQFRRQAFSPFSQNSWSNISRDGSLFALQSIEMGVDTHSSSLDFAAFSDGTLHNVASAFVGLLSPGSDVFLVGWTTF
jgi:eukaryotic-like serine/threonine-protein kinase